MITRFEIFDGEVMREISIGFLQFFTYLQISKFKLFLIDYIDEKKIKFQLFNLIKSVTFFYQV